MREPFKSYDDCDIPEFLLAPPPPALPALPAPPQLVARACTPILRPNIPAPFGLYDCPTFETELELETGSLEGELILSPKTVLGEGDPECVTQLKLRLRIPDASCPTFEPPDAADFEAGFDENIENPAFSVEITLDNDPESEVCNFRLSGDLKLPPYPCGLADAAFSNADIQYTDGDPSFDFEAVEAAECTFRAIIRLPSPGCPEFGEPETGDFEATFDESTDTPEFNVSISPNDDPESEGCKFKVTGALKLPPYPGTPPIAQCDDPFTIIAPRGTEDVCPPATEQYSMDVSIDTVFPTPPSPGTYWVYWQAFIQNFSIDCQFKRGLYANQHGFYGEPWTAVTPAVSSSMPTGNNVVPIYSVTFDAEGEVTDCTRITSLFTLLDLNVQCLDPFILIGPRNTAATSLSDIEASAHLPPGDGSSLPTAPGTYTWKITIPLEEPTSGGIFRKIIGSPIESIWDSTTPTEPVTLSANELTVFVATIVIGTDGAISNCTRLLGSFQVDWTGLPVGDSSGQMLYWEHDDATDTGEWKLIPVDNEPLDDCQLRVLSLAVDEATPNDTAPQWETIWKLPEGPGGDYGHLLFLAKEEQCWTKLDGPNTSELADCILSVLAYAANDVSPDFVRMMKIPVEDYADGDLLTGNSDGCLTQFQAPSNDSVLVYAGGGLDWKAATQDGVFVHEGGEFKWHPKPVNDAVLAYIDGGFEWLEFEEFECPVSGGSSGD